MSHWDPHWSEFQKSVEDESASAPPSPSAAAAAAPHGASVPTSLRRLNACIKDYIVELGLSDLAQLFLMEAEKKPGIPPVPFVEMWIQLENRIIPCSPPLYDKQMAAMLSLNEGIKRYLDYLKIETKSFSAKV